MKKLFYFGFCVLAFLVIYTSNPTEAISQIYENCPNNELSFSILDEETKMCGNSGRGGSGSSRTFLVCNPDPVQCCPGLSIPQEPSCFTLAP